MKQVFWLAPIALSLIFILAGCDTKQEQQPPGTNTPSTPGAKMSDSDLERAIRAKLESDDALKQAKLSVSADADKNQATISGTVVSQEMRTKAVDLAKNAQPGITIEDQIEVKPAA